MASNILDCYIKLPSGKTITLNMSPSETIKKACQQIAEQEHMLVDRVNLKYQGKVLQKTHTLGYLGVCKETILKAEIIQVKRLNIFVRMPSGKTVPVTIENVSPVRYINDAIETQETIPTRSQILKLSGRTLSNVNQTCQDAGITDECVITLEVREIPPSSKNKKKKVMKEIRRGRTGSTGSGGSSCGEEEDEVIPQVAETEEMDQELTQKLLGTFDSQGRNVEVAFSFDTTGSMYSCLGQVRSKLKATVTRLIEEISNIRIAIMAHGDYCDYNKYVVKYQDFTNDVDTLVKFVSDVDSTGGGDSPECYEWCMRKAQQLDWSEDSAKAFVMIGDDVPHPVSMTDQKINWHEEIDLLKGQGVKIYGVRAQHSNHAVPFYQEISEHTGGAYIEFKNFGVITEMFLAVCYKEAGAEQFEQFREEMEQNVVEGTVNEEVKAILTQIDTAEAKAKEDKPKRYVAAPWWDPMLDKNRPQYSYDAVTDTWGPFNRKNGEGQLSRHSSISRRSATPTHPATTAAPANWKTRISRTFSKKGRPTSAPVKTENKKSCVVM